jgi:hypothetical protein
MPVRTAIWSRTVSRIAAGRAPFCGSTIFTSLTI